FVDEPLDGVVRPFGESARGGVRSERGAHDADDPRARPARDGAEVRSEADVAGPLDAGLVGQADRSDLHVEAARGGEGPRLKGADLIARERRALREDDDGAPRLEAAADLANGAGAAQPVGAVDEDGLGVRGE